MKQRNDIDVDIIKEWNVKGKFMWIVLDQGSENSSTIQGDASRVCKGKRTVYSTEKETSAPVDVTTSDSGDYLRSIWITLGMTGRFINAEHPDAGSALVRWTLECMDITNNAIRRLYYHDARNFGTLKMSSSRKDLEKKLASIGPDMLSDELTDDSFLEIMSKQNANLNICKFLMDQKVGTSSMWLHLRI